MTRPEIEGVVEGTPPAVRNISDTARWVATFRARETERPDALFHDPYAKRLAGEHGFHIANTLADGNTREWAWVARTALFDEFVCSEIREGADLVLNLAAGLDARPYRLPLSGSLRWVEVDLPEILAYKEEILANEKPRCSLERLRLDLADASGRRSLFAELNRTSKRMVVLTEGLLIYFTQEEVRSLAADLEAGDRFQAWIVDLVSPGQLRLMQRTMGAQLSEAGAPFKFAPAEGTNFFLQHGWKPERTKGLLTAAAQFNRLPAELRAFLPEPERVPISRPWSGVCLLKRSKG